MNEKIKCFIEHAYNPRYINYNADGKKIIVESIKCADQLTIFLPLSKGTPITFTGDCCRFCMASASLVIDAINNNLVVLVDLNINFIYDNFGKENVEGKEDCCSLILKALQSVIETE